MTARSDIEDHLLDEALIWHQALESDDADWDGYTSWLEADPRHRQAFDSVAIVNAAVEEHGLSIGALLAAQHSGDTPRTMRPRRWALGGVAAAALALVIAVPMLRHADPVTTYRTEPGSSRDFALTNGVNVTLSPSSAIVVTGKDAAKIELARGEAYFDVRHDPARTLTVTVNGYRVTDIGTRFIVNAGGGGFHVGVSEGTVSVLSPRSNREIRINAGQQMFGGDGNATVAPVAPDDIGSWRSGRLSYSDAPLPLVAADIARYSGKHVIVDPSLEKSHFSGILVIGDGTGLLADLANVMAVRVSPEKGGYRLSADPSR